MLTNLAIILVTLLGGWLRFRGLAAAEFWYDEAFSALLVRRDWGEMWGLIAQDVHPPLYYTLLKVWAELFGHSAFALRSLSAFFGTLLIPITWNFVRKSFGNGRGWVPLAAAGLITLNPFLIDYSQEARAYSLLALLLLLAGHFFYQGLIRSPLKFNLSWFLFSVFISLSLLTHYAAVFGVASLGIFALVYFTYAGLMACGKLRLFVLGVQASLLPLLTCLVWWPTFQLQRARTSGGLGWIPKSKFTDIPRSVYAFLLGVEKHALGVPPVNEFTTIIPSESLAFLLCSVLLGVSIYLFKKFKGEAKTFLTFVLVMGLFPIVLTVMASWWGYDLYVERYLIGYGVFFLIYLSLIFSKLPRQLAVPTAILYLVLISMIPAPPENLGYRKLADSIKSGDRSGRVIFSDPLEFVVARVYFGPEFDQRIKIYDFERGSQFEGWILIEDYQVVSSPSEFGESDWLVATRPPDKIRYRNVQEIGQFHIYEKWDFR